MKPDIKRPSESHEVAARLNEDDANEEQVLRLYVSAASPLSSRATVGVRQFLERFLPGQYRLVVIDIGSNVPLAKLDQVIASPTLVRLFPLPQQRFIGDLSNVERLRVSLGLRDAGGSS